MIAVGLMARKDGYPWLRYVFPITAIATREMHMTEFHSGPLGLAGKKVAEFDAAGALVFDAAAVGPLLGLAPAKFMEKLGKGLIYHRHEQGIAEDCGRVRITFRYRARQSILILDAAGRVLNVE
ncbi:MAG TPA: DUF6522 family protein [Azospirillum sp.]|nr:DUF6522 family protein [Azospirillum sp.]